MTFTYEEVALIIQQATGAKPLGGPQPPPPRLPDFYGRQPTVSGRVHLGVQQHIPQAVLTNQAFHGRDLSQFVQEFFPGTKNEDSGKSTRNGGTLKENGIISAHRIGTPSHSLGERSRTRKSTPNSEEFFLQG
jgi:hypothetical protein